MCLSVYKHSCCEYLIINQVVSRGKISNKWGHFIPSFRIKSWLSARTKDRSARLMCKVGWLVVAKPQLAVVISRY